MLYTHAHDILCAHVTVTDVCSTKKKSKAANWTHCMHSYEKWARKKGKKNGTTLIGDLNSNDLFWIEAGQMGQTAERLSDRRGRQTNSEKNYKKKKKNVWRPTGKPKEATIFESISLDVHCRMCVGYSVRQTPPLPTNGRTNTFPTKPFHFQRIFRRAFWLDASIRFWITHTRHTSYHFHTLQRFSRFILMNYGFRNGRDIDACCRLAGCISLEVCVWIRMPNSTKIENVMQTAELQRPFIRSPEICQLCRG